MHRCEDGLMTDEMVPMSNIATCKPHIHVHVYTHTCTRVPGHTMYIKVRLCGQRSVGLRKSSYRYQLAATL